MEYIKTVLIFALAGTAFRIGAWLIAFFFGFVMPFPILYIGIPVLLLVTCAFGIGTIFSKTFSSETKGVIKLVLASITYFVAFLSVGAILGQPLHRTFATGTWLVPLELGALRVGGAWKGHNRSQAIIQSVIFFVITLLCLRPQLNQNFESQKTKFIPSTYISNWPANTRAQLATQFMNRPTANPNSTLSRGGLKIKYAGAIRSRRHSVLILLTLALLEDLYPNTMDCRFGSHRKIN